MIYNTLTNLTMRADYRSWEPVMEPVTRFHYRDYAEAVNVNCSIAVSPIGQVSLYCKDRLQTFAIIQNIEDSVGNDVMDGVWYSIQKVTPVFDASGALSSYRHTLAVLDPSLVRAPIEPVPFYPDLDQQPW